METWDETQAGQVTDLRGGGQMDALNQLENDVKSAVIAAVRSGVNPDTIVSSITGFLGREYPEGTVTPAYMSPPRRQG